MSRSLELADEHAIERFAVTTSLHDVVRLGRSDLVVDRLATQANRSGATWWDRTCSAHADALQRADGDALIDVSITFEGGGLDLHAGEAAAEAARAYERRADRIGAARARARVDTLLVRCGDVRSLTIDLLTPMLTAREHQVAELAATGLRNAEIADRLGTSARTVSNQLQNVYTKLGVHSRVGLREIIDRGAPDGRGV